MDRYRNARLKLVRATDGKSFGGWIDWLSPSRAQLAILDPGDLKVGDIIRGEAHGLRRKGCFSGVVTEQDETTFSIELAGQPAEMVTSEDARILVERLRGRIRLTDRTIPFQVVDMNSRGLGIRLDEQLEEGLRIDLGLVTEDDVMVVSAEVRHCRPDGKGKFRAGMWMYEFGRVDQARWRQLMFAYFRREMTEEPLTSAS